jgi:macrodomain Ter protein organizer (MatP/YcbG family)
MSVTVRKNFVLEQKVANHLEELANKSNQSMTALIQDMIEERYQKLRAQQRKEVLKEMRGFGNGLLTDFSIQSVKANMDV